MVSRNGTQQWHQQLASSHGTPQWHPAMAHQQWHPAMAPNNGTQAMGPSNGAQQWHPTWTPLELVASIRQWHRAMASNHCPHNGAQQWHPSDGTHCMAPRQWHPSMAPRGNGTQHDTQQWFAKKLSKTDLDENKSVEQEKKISEWSCKATEHLDETTLLNKRARGWLAWRHLADVLLWLRCEQIASAVANVNVWKKVWVCWVGWKQPVEC